MTAGTVVKNVSDARSKYRDVAELERVFDSTFEVWARGEDGVFSSALEEQHEQVPTNELAKRCEQAYLQGEPGAYPCETGQCLLVVPIRIEDGADWLATTQVTTDSPNLALQLVKATLSDLASRKEVEQLQQESSVYLQQLSEDLEELVFLRSMADRLALGGLSLRSENLMPHVLPQLGEAASVEELHFVDRRGGGKHYIAESWKADDGQGGVDLDVIEKLVAQYCETTVDQPTVRNHFQQSSEGRLYPGVREFALVSVSTSMATLGWLVAINRRLPLRQRHHDPIWKLNENELGSCEASLISTTAAMLASHAHNVALFEERESLLISVVRTLVSAIESRDPYTCGHSERVARYGRRLAREIGFDEESCERLYMTGLLHDIGKIGLSDLVLKKTGPLTEEEFAEIKKHPDLGWAILRELESMEYVLPGVLHHHERHDGKGYPDGLVGQEAPLEGRLLAVVDAFDAMTSDRPYRSSMPLEKAFSILQEGAGSQWDAEIVEAFLKITPDIVRIRESYRRPPLPVRKPKVVESVQPVLENDSDQSIPEFLPS